LDPGDGGGGDCEKDIKEDGGGNMSVSGESSRSKSVSHSSSHSSSISHRLFATLLVHFVGGVVEKGIVGTAAGSLSGGDVEGTKVGC
jgi:hypothetical protein